MGLIFGQDLHNDHLHQLQKVFLSPILSQTNDLITFVSVLLEVRLKTLGGRRKSGLLLFFLLVALLKHKVRTAAAREYLNDFATLLLFAQSELCLL